MGEGREGDWECSGCRNRNYAFRSFCNRCKQPRLLVDANTPADSKWLPRIGDWICAGCSNNNYASREKCKKCGQTKEEAAMPAIAMPGISLPSYSQYLARIQGLYGSRMNFLQSGNPTFQPFQPGSNWSFWAADNYGMQPLSGKGGHSSLENTNKLPALPKTWRNGDWICDCGFHNYSSRSECKKCNAPLPSGGPSGTSTTKLNIYPTLGTKRSASQEFANEWDNKRLNAGVIASNFLSSGQQHSFHSLEQRRSSSYDQPSSVYGKIPTGNLMTASAQLSLYSSPQRAVPTLLGKGAKQWRDGDWMCNNCNNHNYASRSFCNRCKTQKEAASLPVSVA